MFARVWSCGYTAAYTQTGSLGSTIALPYSFHTEVAAFQVSRAIARSLSGYASYTLENQTNSSTAGTSDVFDGLFQVVAFGLTYSPSATHFGRP
jgi:hypothetical protein